MITTAQTEAAAVLSRARDRALYWFGGRWVTRAQLDAARAAGVVR